MTKMVPIASIALILAFTIATGAAEAGPGSLANRGHGGGPGLQQLPAGGPGGGPLANSGPANRGPGPAHQQDDGPLAGAKQGGPAAKLGNRTTSGGNTYNGGTATGTPTGTYAGGNAATVSGNTVSGNTAGSNNTVNVTGNQANGTATGYGYPYAAPIVVAPTSGASSASASSATTSASCPSGTSMQSITTTAQGQTTVVCVATNK